MCICYKLLNKLRDNMCGIFAYIAKNKDIDTNKLIAAAKQIEHRGPDNFQYITTNIGDYSVFLGFTRLSINDTSELGNQPMILLHETEPIYLICNGEIYNHKVLEKKYNIETKSKSDCEIILHLYKQIGPRKMINELDGVFAFVLVDVEFNRVYVGRDPIGVRPVFQMYDSTGDEFIFASEMKAIIPLLREDTSSLSEYIAPQIIKQVTPGTLKCFLEMDNILTKMPTYTYYSVYNELINDSHNTDTNNEQQIVNLTEKIDKSVKIVKNTLEAAVFKRLMSDRPIGCLLSGGLDSSIIAALVSKLSQKQNPDFKLHTFSIGMEGATDLKYAKIVAEHIGSIHHEITFTPEEGLAALPTVVKSIESFDVTTVRASTGMYLISKWINENTDIKVIFSGEGADEVGQGYIYFHNAPDSTTSHNESLRLIDHLHKYDVLRGDRTTAAHGLEIRVPFLDKKFIREYINLDKDLRACCNENVIDNSGKKTIEKYLIREAFKDLLPEVIIYRPKEAFSDGVSSVETSWHTIIADYVNEQMRDLSEIEEKGAIDYTISNNLQPYSREQYYYWKEFQKNYPNQKPIDYIWMPKYSETNDPSARSLNIYTS